MRLRTAVKIMRQHGKGLRVGMNALEKRALGRLRRTPRSRLGRWAGRRPLWMLTWTIPFPAVGRPFPPLPSFEVEPLSDGSARSVELTMIPRQSDP